MQTLTLPYPPSTNRIWRRAGNRTIKSDAAKKYQREAAIKALISGVTRFSGPIRLDVTLHPKKPLRKPKNAVRCIDLSNAIKCAEDSLNGVAWEDDRQIEELTARRAHPVEGGALILRWEQITDD